VLYYFFFFFSIITMNSQSSLYPMTTMAVLILLVAMVSTMASANTSTLRRLHPKPNSVEALGSALDLAKDVADECQDDPDWRHKDVKSCASINEKEERKIRKCKRSHFKKHCKETCGQCERTKCPKHVDSDKFEESCKDYKDGLECFYNYSVVGCAADGSDFSCNPGTSWTCGDDFKWKKEFLPQRACISEYEDWGTKCDPEIYQAPEPEEVDGATPGLPKPEYCPLEPPPHGTPCTRLGDEAANPDGCEYDHIVTGCTFDELGCYPIEWAYCEGKDPKEVCKGDICRWIEETYWTTAISSLQFCDDQPEGSPWSNTCDPLTFAKEDYAEIYSTPSTPTDKPYDCPERRPSKSDHCMVDGIIPPDGCPYGYIVSGCTQDTLSCGPVKTTKCKATKAPFFDVNTGILYDGTWEIESKARESCDDQPEGSPWCDTCDPLTFAKEDYSEIYTTPPSRPIEYDCPERRPSYTDHCKLDGIIPPNGCPYGYIVSGCTQDTLSCGPVVTAECEATNEPLIDVETGEYYDGIWLIMSRSIEFCDDQPRDWPSGEYCDPSRFDASDYVQQPPR